jgi:hypothetical protein
MHAGTCGHVSNHAGESTDIQTRNGPISVCRRCQDAIHALTPEQRARVAHLDQVALTVIAAIRAATNQDDATINLILSDPDGPNQPLLARAAIAVAWWAVIDAATTRGITPGEYLDSLVASIINLATIYADELKNPPAA